MIDERHFQQVWRNFASRWPKQRDDVELAYLYFRFLAPRLTNGTFEQAAMQLWASASFFPRPIDFLLSEVDQDYQHACAAARLFNAMGEGALAYKAKLELMSPIGQSAVESIGGIITLRQKWEQHKLTEAEWRSFYERRVIAATKYEAAALLAPVARALPEYRP